MDACNVVSRDGIAKLVPGKDIAHFEGQRILVVLDDDPVVTQTCRGIPLLLSWDQRTLIEELRSLGEGFIILTSSKTRLKLDAAAQIRQICIAVEEAAVEAGKDVEIVIRSDSALKGLFPDDLQVTEEVIDAVERLRIEEEAAPLGPKALGVNTLRGAPGGLIIAGLGLKKVHESLIERRRDKLSVITLQLHDLLKGSEERQQVLLAAADQAGEHIASGQDVLLTTNVATTDVQNIELERVARALVHFVRSINPQPRYLMTEDIIAHDIASNGLRMRKAQVVGQAAQGLSIWRCEEATSKWAGIPFVSFPSNARDENALRDVVDSWATSMAAPKMQYQRLGKSALRVSRIILGCMSYGDPNWEGSPWILPEEESLPLLKKAYDLGINTWDTANTYSNGRSEEIIGKALRTYSIPRSKVVIMTKVYYPVMSDSSRPAAINSGPLANQMGLSRKHILDAVDASLRRLGTSYIDVLQLHRLDRDAEPEEVMRALHDLVAAGKVHYIAGSSMYAWEFARLQMAAKVNGWTPFTSMQNFYNLLYREEEREMNPFCGAEGIGVTPWSPLARGLLGRPRRQETERSKQDAKARKWFGEAEGQNHAIIDRVEVMARRKGCSMAAISTAWLLKKGCAPIVGVNSVQRMEETLEAFEAERLLTDADLKWLEEPYRPLSIQAI